MEAAIQTQVLRSGSIEIHPNEFLALAGGRPLNLTARELALLTTLVLRQGRIVSREEIYAAVWDEPYRKSDRSVDVYVAKLRQKLDRALPNARFIHTHFGFGYRLEQEPPPPAEGSLHRFHIPETSP
ncbi:MAG TPA: winged helix-turn-helix domain-containing protein [Thermoleophilaceae bacterium]|nr:winged helix-turn-helix domain-containing protein [Thermoleophilaceae bacterium]